MSTSRASTPRRIGRAAFPSAYSYAPREQGKYEAEAWRVRKDGSRFWANVVVEPVRDPRAAAGFAKITRDMTERRQQQRAFEQARAALAQAQKMEALGQLSGGIAHDYNNLLHVIRNAVEMLQRRLPAGSSRKCDCST